MPSMFDRPPFPDAHEVINKPHRRRAAALSLASGITREPEEAVALAVFILDGAEGYNHHQILRDARLVAYKAATEDDDDHDDFGV